MSYLGRNIKKIRTAKKISQTAFADLFDLKRGSIGAYEEGRAEAKIDKVIEIASYFNLSVDQLLCKELTFNEIYHIPEIHKKFETSDFQSSVKNIVPLIRTKDRIEFLSNYNKQEYINELFPINLPDVKRGSLAFELTIEDFLIDDAGIGNGAIAIAEPVNLKQPWESFSGEIFLIIENEKFIFGRVFFDVNRLLIRSVNLNSYCLFVHNSDIRFIFKTYLLISNGFLLTSDIGTRLSGLELKLDKILKLR